MSNLSTIDMAYTERCYKNDLKFLKDEFFRCEVSGAENIPFDEAEKRPVIFIANHSGMTLSWDNIIFDVALFELLEAHYGSTQMALEKKLRRLIDPQLIGGMKNLNLFSIPNWWTKLGCVAATIDNFESLARQGGFLFLSPEGVAGIGKGFNKRYQLQRYSSSFIYIALKYNALVVPVSIVNAEYLRPFNYSFGPINRFVQKHAGIPYLPVGESLTQFIFPATFLNPYPAKIVYKIHDPVSFKGDVENMTKDELRSLAEAFRQQHQQLLNAAVSEHHFPYQLRELWRAFLRSKRKKMFCPFFWHEMFHQTAGTPKSITRAHKVPFGFALVNKLAEKSVY